MEALPVGSPVPNAGLKVLDGFVPFIEAVASAVPLSVLTVAGFGVTASVEVLVAGVLELTPA